MPSIKITGHKHQSVRTIVNTVAADGITVTDQEDVLIERVWATFEIEGAESFTKKGRSTTPIHPATLVVCYQSKDGGTWERAGSSEVTVEGWNVKKDGSRGADTAVRYYDLPDSLKVLFAPTADQYYRDGGPAFEWINSEYPR